MCKTLLDARRSVLDSSGSSGGVSHNLRETSLFWTCSSNEVKEAEGKKEDLGLPQLVPQALRPKAVVFRDLDAAPASGLRGREGPGKRRTWN